MNKVVMTAGLWLAMSGGAIGQVIDSTWSDKQQMYGEKYYPLYLTDSIAFSTVLATTEDNDCSVIAWSVASGRPYDSSHLDFELYVNRKHGHGLGVGQWFDSYRFLSYKTQVDINPIRPCDDCPRGFPAVRNEFGSVKEFAANNKEGRYMVFVSGHALAVIDGVVYDQYQNLKANMKLTVRYVFEVIPPSYLDVESRDPHRIFTE